MLMTVAGSLGELNAWMFAGTKGLLISTQEDCLPRIFKRTNYRGVPVNLLIFQAVVVTIFTGIFALLDSADTAYWILSALSIQMYLVMYVLLFLSAMILRFKEPEAKRLYSIPGGNKVMLCLGILGILACTFVFTVSFFPPKELVQFTQFAASRYSLSLMGSFLACIAIPVVIYKARQSAA